VGRLNALVLDVSPLRKDRDFRLLWSGQLISGLGRQVTVIALPYQLYVLTHSAIAIGALALVQLGPLLAFSLFGGAVADAVDRRRLLLLTQSGLALTSAALALLAMQAQPSIWALYFVAFVAATISSVDQPARASAVPRLVPRERLPLAIALNQAAFQAAAVVGPALGGILIATLGLAAAYGLDAVTFAASLLVLAMMAPIPPLHGVARPGVKAVAEGLRFARRMPVILSTFVVDLDAMIFGMPAALFPVLAVDVFHNGAAGVGLMASAAAVGALVGALLTGWVGRVRYEGRAVILAVAVWGVAIALFGLCTFSFPLALVFLAIAGGADVLSAVFRSTILQLSTPDQLRGRMTALHVLVVTGGPRLGDIESTVVAALTSATFSVVSGGVMTLVGLAWVARRFPQLAAYDAHAMRPGAELPATVDLASEA